MGNERSSAANNAISDSSESPPPTSQVIGSWGSRGSVAGSGSAGSGSVGSGSAHQEVGVGAGGSIQLIILLSSLLCPLQQVDLYQSQGQTLDMESGKMLNFVNAHYLGNKSSK